MEEEKQTIQDKVKEQTESKIDEVLAQGIQSGNIDFLSKLVDIYKDIEDIKMKEEYSMRYDYYGKYEDNRFGDNYGRRMRDSKGRFMDKGYGAKYRGEGVLNDMYDSYREYAEGKSMFGEGHYGHKKEAIKTLEYMLQSVVDFMCMLEEDANSQEEIDLVRSYKKHISEI